MLRLPIEAPRVSSERRRPPIDDQRAEAGQGWNRAYRFETGQIDKFGEEWAPIEAGRATGASPTEPRWRELRLAIVAIAGCIEHHESFDYLYCFMIALVVPALPRRIAHSSSLREWC